MQSFWSPDFDISQDALSYMHKQQQRRQYLCNN